MALDRPRENPHRIGRLRFEFAGGEERILIELRNRLAKAAKRDLPAALEAALDPVAGPDDVVEIARLEVDLGRIDPDALSVGAIAAAAGAALAKHAPGLTTDAVGASTQTVAEGEAGDAPPRRRSLAAAALDAFLIFLETGHPPPASPSRRIDWLIEAAAEAPLAAAEIAAKVESAAAAGQTYLARRLIAATPADIVADWLSAARPDVVERLDGRVALLRTLETATTDHATLVAAAQAVTDAFVDHPDAMAPDPDAIAEFTGETAPSAPPRHAETVGLPAENAGVVLLHPFLPALFKRCELTEGRGFCDEAAQIAAADLVAWLATGRTAEDEVELLIPRALCGLGPETPSPPAGPIDPAHAAEAEALLRSAIGHWRKLGATSPDGLREGFLIRPGLLYEEPPRIVVEDSGLDVLIDHLPWALSPVRLPWLAQPIVVDWR